VETSQLRTTDGVAHHRCIIDRVRYFLIYRRRNTCQLNCKSAPTDQIAAASSAHCAEYPRAAEYNATSSAHATREKHSIKNTKYSVGVTVCEIEQRIVAIMWPCQVFLFSRQTTDSWRSFSRDALQQDEASRCVNFPTTPSDNQNFVLLNLPSKESRSTRQCPTSLIRMTQSQYITRETRMHKYMLLRSRSVLHDSYQQIHLGLVRTTWQVPSLDFQFINDEVLRFQNMVCGNSDLDKRFRREGAENNAVVIFG
jgi:hypothetical protein